MDSYDHTDSMDMSPESNILNQDTEINNDGEMYDTSLETKTVSHSNDMHVSATEYSPPTSNHPLTLSNSSISYMSDKPSAYMGKPHSTYLPSGPRRSSSRSIKRPKFDDELVDTSALKRTSYRRSSESSPSEQKNKKAIPKLSQTSTSSSSHPKKNKKKIKPTPVPTDFGRWRPTDDLSLISAVTQTCDLQTVHLAVRFSCNFTMKDIQDRWFALLYDPLVSRLAQQSMKALPSDVVEQILNNALWSRDEDAIIGDINIADNYTLEDFQGVLDQNLHVFHKTRTAKILQNHWVLLRHYQLLNCQHTKNILSSSTHPSLADMEGKIVDDQIVRTEDDALNQELAVSDRSYKREIKQLEQEIPHWEIMIESSGYLEGYNLCDFSNNTLAVLKGRILKYSMVKNQVIIGRNSLDFEVDIDLSIEGPALKISRQQGLILYEDGIFYLENTGKRPFYINGFPLANGQSARLVNDSMIEIYCIKLLFLINPSIESVDEQHESVDEQNSMTKIKDKSSWDGKTEE